MNHFYDIFNLNNMRLAYFIFFFLLISCNNEPEWKYLFNGENLDGWEIKIREHKIGMPLTEGYISLQSEGHPISFRNIKIKKL